MCRYHTLWSLCTPHKLFCVHFTALETCFHLQWKPAKTFLYVSFRLFHRDSVIVSHLLPLCNSAFSHAVLCLVCRGQTENELKSALSASSLGLYSLHLFGRVHRRAFWKLLGSGAAFVPSPFRLGTSIDRAFHSGVIAWLPASIAFVQNYKTIVLEVSIS